jgi:hypothetical protein
MAVDSNEKGRAHGIGLWLRLALYAAMLPPLGVVATGRGRPQTAVALVIVGLVLCLGSAAWPRSRRATARVFARSRLLRGVDALFWNLALLLAIGEVALAVAGRFVSSPLLVTPNARSQERIEESRRHVIDYFGRDAGNARGHNDREPLADASGVVRIVALGDSFAYGVVGYDANFLTLLEAQLAERAGARVEVVNLGLPNLQPKDYLQMLVDDGLPLHPDLVLVCLFAGNDFKPPGNATFLDARNWRMVAFATRLFGVLRERAREPYGPRRSPAARYAGSASKESGAAPKGWVPPPQVFSEEAYLGIAKEYVPVVRRAPDDDTRAAIDDALGIVGEIAARAAPAPVAVAVLPSELQVNPALRARVLASLALQEGDLDLDRPARATRAALESRGVTVIDLLPPLAAAERDAPTYALRDSHWNERGNAVAARALAEALEPPVRRIAATKSAPAGYGRATPPAEDPP